MTEFLQLPEEIRKQLITQASIKRGANAQAIEKDWWVTLVLHALFTCPLAQYFIFKGGTSLSKGWKLIERFSEDIDIALLPEILGKEYITEPSHRYVKTLKREGCQLTNTTIKDTLTKKLASFGIPIGMIDIQAEEMNPELPDKDPQSLYIHYPSLYDKNPYIQNAVKIEFSVRGIKEPYSSVKIRSIIAEETDTPVYKETSFEVKAVHPRKTFLEKIILLHEMFLTQKDAEEIGQRQSRHLYDIREMAGKDIVEQVIQDKALFDQLLIHRKYYVRLKDVDYSTMKIANLQFLPPPALMATFKTDYGFMQDEMIYGDSPDFEKLIKELEDLKLKLNTIGKT